MVKSGGMKELQAYLDAQAFQLCEFATNEVYEAINFFLAQYYSEDWDSRIYQRTKDFLNSAFKTEVKKRGNTFYAEIGIDYESLDNYEDATGLQIITFANNALHGGIDVGTNTRVWDDAMDATVNSGQLLADCIAFMKGRGLFVTGI